MKKQILILGTAILFTLGSATFIGCGNSEHGAHEDHQEHVEGEHSHEEVAESAYFCPMKCEEDKTYAEEGACPVCGMDLVEVK